MEEITQKTHTVSFSEFLHCKESMYQSIHAEQSKQFSCRYDMQVNDLNVLQIYFSNVQIPTTIWRSDFHCEPFSRHSRD